MTKVIPSNDKYERKLKTPKGKRPKKKGRNKVDTFAVDPDWDHVHIIDKRDLGL